MSTLFFLSRGCCFSQFSNSSECCVFRVPTVRPVETDCCCCCCCWHPRVWCYCWNDFGCNWNLDISGVGGCRLIEVCLTVPLFMQAHLIWYNKILNCVLPAPMLFSCKHTWYDKILNFISPVPLLFSRHKNWLRANSSGFSGNSRSRSSRWRSWGNC